MRYYLGIDWADESHVVWVEDEQGAPILTHTVPHTPAGFAEWGRWLHEQRAAGIELWAALERPDGRVVDFLLDHDIVVFPVNPKALDRARERVRVSGAKSDPFDARVLAGFIRKDHAELRPLQPNSPAAQELKLLARDHARLLRQQTRLLNQLTATLKEHYPRALEVCPDLTTARAQAFLAAFPTPAAVAALTETRWARWARSHRLPAAETARLWPVLQAPQLPVPAHVVRAKARLVAALCAQLAPTLAAVAEYRALLSDFFAHLPTAAWARTLPGAATGTTVPWLVAEIGDARERWASAADLQSTGGVVPCTKASGKHKAVLFRFGCNKWLRTAAHQLAWISLPKSEWARAYYDRHRAQGHSHHHALRALAAKWLKIIFACSRRQVPYDETYHLATMARQQLRQRLPAA